MRNRLISSIAHIYSLSHFMFRNKNSLCECSATFHNQSLEPHPHPLNWQRLPTQNAMRIFFMIYRLNAFTPSIFSILTIDPEKPGSTEILPADFAAELKQV